MDKNLVVSLDEIKGIRLQCKECGSEVVVSPTNPPSYGRLCPQGHPWQEPSSPNDNVIYTFLGACPINQVRFRISSIRAM